MKKETKVAKKVNIEDLVKQQETTAPLIKRALEAHKRSEEEKKEKEIISQLKNISENTQNAVQRLRDARKAESMCKKYLQEIANAEQQFHKDADYEAYAFSKNKAWTEYIRSL